MIFWAAAVAAAIGLVFALTAAVAAPAAAAVTVTVTTTADETQMGDGACSLREATLYANGTSEPDCALAPASGITTIIVPGNSTGYLLTRGALSLTGNAAIGGAGAATTMITAGGMSQVFSIQAGANVAISNLTISGGLSGQVTGTNKVDGRPGGGINNDGTLALAHVIVSGNRTSPGAVDPACTPSATQACDGGDGGDGGGISNTGTLTIADSAITANSTGDGAKGKDGVNSGSGGRGGHGGHGGGISNSLTGTLTITTSMISGNTTGAGAAGGRGGNDTSSIGGSGGFGGFGGGIENSGPRLVISRTTIAGNRTAIGGDGGDGGAGTGRGGAGGNGGSGGAIDTSTDMTISNSTVAANATARGGAIGMGGSSSGITPKPGVPGNGGGIDQSAMGSTITHVTIASNIALGAGGGIDGDGGTINAGNSIVASNVAATPSQNCAGVITDQGSNLEFGASSCPPGFVRADPRLAILANNGGPTQTIALEPGSAAIHRVRTCVLTTDQRGVGRPVGQPCDSGAYQVAPPSLSGISAAAITTTSVTIAAGANPNLRESTVVVNYGRTPSYGSSTPPRDIGAGNASAPFTTALSGLAPGTTYHFDVVATNGDGQTTSGDGVFTTLAPLTASITGAATTGPTLSLTIVCAGGFGPGTCAGTIRLTARGTPKTTRAGKHKGTHPAGKPPVVAAGAYSEASGSRVTLKLRLNGTGRRLLAARYVLPTMLSMRGTTLLTRAVTFRYPVIKTKPSYTFTVNTDGSSTVTELTVTHLLRHGRVRVICQGGGCPFAQRAFAPKHGQVIATPSFLHHTLQPGASVRVEVLAANHIGAVWILTPRIGPSVTAVRLCLPPGAARPARCVVSSS